MSERRKGHKKTILRIPVSVSDNFELPPQFERYVTLKAASDLLALEAEKEWQKMFKRLPRAGSQ